MLRLLSRLFHPHPLSRNIMSTSKTIHEYFPQGQGREWKEPFYFLQAADCQLGLIERYLEKKENPGWSKEVDLTRRAIIAANAMRPKPKFLVICGDLVDAMPGWKDRDAQVKDLKDILKNLDNEIPLVCVCGNHDVGDKPTVDSVQLYRGDFGPDFFTFEVSGVLMIVLNSQYYMEHSQVTHLYEEQNQWLDSVLSSASGFAYKHVVVFQHIPWFLNNADEEKDPYFNIEPVERNRMLNKLYDGGVRYIFCGHYHRNTGGKFKDLELVVTSAIGAQLGSDKSGFRVVKVHEDKISHEYFALEDVPKQVML